MTINPSKTEKIATCSVCGKQFSKGSSSGILACPECSGNREKALNRVFTRDTVFLVCKWYREGMTVKRLASLLQRSEDSIRLALTKGGIKV